MRKFLITITALFLLLSRNEATIVNAGDGGRFGAKWQDAKSNISRKAMAKNKLAFVKSGWRNGASASPASHARSLQQAAGAEAVYFENFNAGAPGWTFQDRWSESSWHPSTTGALSGKSYWCGIEVLGGYDDGWLQTLTSSAITLPTSANLSLTFMHNYSVEDTVGSSANLPPGYNAWDAITVRLSTDGTTFNVITPTGGYPAANAFGFYFYYGSGFPGWFGSSGGWVPATFNLTAFSGQTVRIRFEFGSDEFFSGADDPSFFGWRVDDVAIKDGTTTVFSDNAGDTGLAQFVAGGLGGPNLWHFTSRAAHSAPNSAGCFDPATGNYQSGMLNALVSPAIAIDALPANTLQLIPDFQVQGNLNPTPDFFGFTDLFLVEARVYIGGVWSYWDYLGFTGGLPPSFAGYNETDPFFPFIDPSVLIGVADSVQFRLELYSLPDGAVVPPANVFVDDFTLTALTTPAAPVIVLILDIPEDQGRQVRVTWLPSDSEGLFDAISHYVLWRRVEGLVAQSQGIATAQHQAAMKDGATTGSRVVIVPDMAGLHDYAMKSGKPGDRLLVAAANQAWDFIAAVPSHRGFEFYNYVAPTLADSNASGTNNATFMVSAYDRVGGFADSEADNGYSVDNLAPGAPANFAAKEIEVEQRSAIQLTWEESEDKDFAYFALYKDGVADPLLRTTDLSYTDTKVQVGDKPTYRLTAFDFNGNEGKAAQVSLTVTRVKDRPTNNLPTEYALSNSYPNPFNPQTTIMFALVERGKVMLTIYDAMGQEVEKLAEAEMPAGFHHLVWDAKNRASGLYFYRLTVNDFSQIKKMVLLR